MLNVTKFSGHLKIFDFLLVLVALDHSLCCLSTIFRGKRLLIFFLLLCLLCLFVCLLCRFLFLNLFLKCWCLSGFCPKPLVFLLYISSQRLSLLTPVVSFTLCVYKALLYYKPRWLSWALDLLDISTLMSAQIFSLELNSSTSPSPVSVYGTPI